MTTLKSRSSVSTVSTKKICVQFSVKFYKVKITVSRQTLGFQSQGPLSFRPHKRLKCLFSLHSLESDLWKPRLETFKINEIRGSLNLHFVGGCTDHSTLNYSELAEDITLRIDEGSQTRKRGEWETGVWVTVNRQSLLKRQWTQWYQLEVLSVEPV